MKLTWRIAAVAWAILLVFPVGVANHPSHLEAGDSTTYSTALGGGLIQALFDDGARADVAFLRYSWKVIANQESATRVDIRILLDIPPAGEGLIGGGISYFGEDVARRANEGDFSFATRFPLTERHKEDVFIVMPSEHGKRIPMAAFPGAFYVERNLTATVYHGNQTIRWDGEPREGKWTLWIDPDTVPFHGNRSLPILLAWPDIEIIGEMKTEDESTFPVATQNVRQFAPGATNWVRWGTSWFTPPDMGGTQFRNPEQVLQNIYDPGTGLLLGTTSGMFIDDTLISQLGLTFYRAEVKAMMTVEDTTVAALRNAISPGEPGRGASTPGPGVGAFLSLTMLVATWSRRGNSRESRS